MKRRTAHSHLTEIAALAPFVVALRIPTLTAEALSHSSPRPETARAWREKTAALAEGAMAMQTTYAAAAVKSWFAFFGGSLEPRALAVAQEEAMLAMLSPVSKRVRANVRRLRR
jgi:hypothetical protein